MSSSDQKKTVETSDVCAISAGRTMAPFYRRGAAASPPAPSPGRVRDELRHCTICTDVLTEIVPERDPALLK